jgi:hypothetical protein
MLPRHAGRLQRIRHLLAHLVGVRATTAEGPRAP